MDVVGDISCHEVSWLQKIHFTSITSCENGWLQFGSASGLNNGSQFTVVDPLVLDDPVRLFDASWLAYDGLD